MAYAPRTRGAALADRAPQLFLSHSARDKAWVSEFAQDLNVCGVDVWFDEWELRVGDDLHERIADAVERSQFVGVVITRNFSESKWIKGEVNQALSREKAEDRTLVLPLLAEDVPPPPTLSTKKFLDFVGDYYGSLARLVGMIHAVPSDAIERAIRRKGAPPDSLSDCFAVFDYAGYHPLHVVGTQTFDDIVKAGGHRDGDIVRFEPTTILESQDISGSLRDLMERLTRLESPGVQSGRTRASSQRRIRRFDRG